MVNLFYSVFAGFFSARLYKTMKGLQWKKSAIQVILQATGCELFLTDGEKLKRLNLIINLF